MTPPLPGKTYEESAGGAFTLLFIIKTLLMLASVSWHDFVVMVVVTTILYYAVIITLFFRNDVFAIVKTGFHSYRNKTVQTIDKEPELFAGINELLDELKTVFHAALASTYLKEELLQALHGILKKYMHLKGTDFETAIIQHIVQAAASGCALSLDDDDIRQIW